MDSGRKSELVVPLPIYAESPRELLASWCRAGTDDRPVAESPVLPHASSAPRPIIVKG